MSKIGDKPTQVFATLISRAQRALKAQDERKAEELFLQAYEHAVDWFGADSQQVGFVLAHLAAVCEEQGKSDLARVYRAELERLCPEEDQRTSS